MSPGVFDQIRRGHRCIKINEQVKKGRYLLPGGRGEGSVDFGWVSIKVAVSDIQFSIVFAPSPARALCILLATTDPPSVPHENHMIPPKILRSPSRPPSVPNR